MAGRCDVRYVREKSGDERREAKYEPLVLTLYNGWAMKNGQKNAKTETDGEGYRKPGWTT